MTPRTTLFLYGSLKRGCHNAAQMIGQTFLGNACTAPGYTLYEAGGYPGMVLQAGDTAGVTGELWQVDEAALARLDRFEGLPERLYTRELVVLAEPHTDEPVFTYVYARPVDGRVRLGSTWVE